MAFTKSSGVIKSWFPSSNVACCRNLALDSLDTPSGASVPSRLSFSDCFIDSAGGRAAILAKGDYCFCEGIEQGGGCSKG